MDVDRKRIARLAFATLLAIVLCGLVSHIQANRSQYLDAEAVQSLMSRFSLWDGIETPSQGYDAWQQLKLALTNQAISRDGCEVLIAKCAQGAPDSPLWSQKWCATYQWLLELYYAHYPVCLPIEEQTFACPINVVVSKNFLEATRWPAGIECPVHVMVSTVWRPELACEVQVLDRRVGGRIVAGSTLRATYVIIPGLPPGETESHFHVTVGYRTDDGDFRHIQNQDVTVKINVVAIPTIVRSQNDESTKTIKSIAACIGFERYTATGGVPMRMLPNSMRAYRLNVTGLAEAARQAMGPGDVVSLKLTVLDQCGTARMCAFCAIDDELTGRNDEVLVLRPNEDISSFSVRVEGDPIAILSQRFLTLNQWPDELRIWKGVMYVTAPLDVRD